MSETVKIDSREYWLEQASVKSQALIAAHKSNGKLQDKIALLNRQNRDLALEAKKLRAQLAEAKSGKPRP